MQPGGTLLLETGNGGDLDSAADYPDQLHLPDHLIFAGREHVRQFLEAANFRLATTIEFPRYTASESLKLMGINAIKEVIGRKTSARAPMFSPFRSVVYKAIAA